mgnify:CR=1 FL=1
MESRDTCSRSRTVTHRFRERRDFVGFSIRYAMNSFVIAAGSYVAPLTAAALKAAKAMGPVSVDMGETSCKVPAAADYIRKVEARGALGKKRKSAKC